MKKTISITLNETNFQIEEDAYIELDKYLNSIKNYYKSEEADEIVFDIEASIAEKFSQKINKAKNVISLKDVKNVVDEMGSVSDFEEGPKEESNKDEENDNSIKRFYRNPDDVIIGGVCSGIAAYFGIDPLFVRIFFVILTIFWGSGILVYLVLLIIIPEAKNNAQKLEMKGRPVNLEEIQELAREKSKKIKAEGKHILENLKNKKGDAYKASNAVVQVIKNFFNFFKKIVLGFFPVLSVFIGVVLMISFALAIAALTISFGILLFNVNSPYIISDLPLAELAGSIYYYLAVVSVYFVVLVPLIFLLSLAGTLIKRKNTFNQISVIVLIVIWILAVTGVAISAVDLGPKINSYVVESQQREQESMDYDISDFSKLNLSGQSLDVKVVQGEDFDISIKGNKRDLGLVSVFKEGEELTIKKDILNRDGKLCIFCWQNKVEAIISMPNLEALSGSKYVDVEVDGFTDNIILNLNDYSSLDWDSDDSGANIFDMDINLSKYSRAKIYNVNANLLNINQSSYTDLYLSGMTNNFEADLSNYSRLSSLDLISSSTLIKTTNYSKADLGISGSIDAEAKNYSKIIYSGDPFIINVREGNYSDILNR